MAQRGGDTGQFDPRFDPAFQPGYDPTGDPTLGARIVPDGPSQYFEWSSPQVLDVGSDSAPPSKPVVSDDRTDVREVILTEADDAAPTNGANPFLIALWAISALLVIAGVGLLRWLPIITEEVQTASTTSYDFYVLESLMFGAPMLIVLGLAAATGILFLHAVNWKKRPPATDASTSSGD